MKKRIISMFLLLLFTVAVFPVSPTGAQSVIDVRINERFVSFERQGPVMIDGRVLVPLRGVFERLGFTVRWDSAARRVTLTRESDVVIVTIGSSTFTTNGVSHRLDVPAQTIRGSTMLPIRTILESVDTIVRWDNRRQRVDIETRHYRLPSRQLTDEERQGWIRDYRWTGGPSAPELDVAQEINKVRAELNLGRVEVNEALMMAARYYLQSIRTLPLTRDPDAPALFGMDIPYHNQGPYSVPGAQHGASRNVARAFGGHLGAWSGGNFASGRMLTAQSVVSGWMSSEGHRRYIVDPETTTALCFCYGIWIVIVSAAIALPMPSSGGRSSRRR